MWRGASKPSPTIQKAARGNDARAQDGARQPPPKHTAFLHVRDEHPGSDSHSSTKGKKRGRHFNSEGQDAPGTQRVAERSYRDVT